MTANRAHTAQAVIVRHEDAELLELPAAAFRLLADGDATDGTVGVNRLSLGTGTDGAKPHYHARSWELFYVLDGTMEFLLDDRLSTVSPGDLVLVPPGMPHAFGAGPGSTADVLVLIAPGIERFGYFRQLQRIALGQEPAESLAPEQDRYDVHFVDSVTWTTTRARSSAHAASTQSEAAKRLYQGWLTAFAENPDWTPGDQQDLIEGWSVLTSEPGAVDYAEIDAGGIPALHVTPHDAQPDRVLLCVHGGGFVSGSMYTHRKLYGHLAKAVGARALIPNYQLLPEAQHPGPLDETLTCYRWLLDQGIKPHHIAITGDSAGGGLAVTATLRARDNGLPLPAASMPLSPWFDMEVVGHTMISNAGKDALFNHDRVKQLAAGVLGDADPKDPYANPLYADLTGLPPLYMQVGGDELLLDDSRRLAALAEKAGVDVRLDVFPEQQHTFQMMAGRAPEADDAIARLAQWVRPRLGL